MNVLSWLLYSAGRHRGVAFRGARERRRNYRAID